VIDRDRFDAFLALADFRRQIREARIARQWQASFALWALLAGAYLKRDELGCAALVAISVGSIAAHFFWLHWHAWRAEQDQAWMFCYLDEAAEAAGAKIPSKQDRRNGLYGHPPALMQGFTTLLLVGAIWF